EDLGFEHAAIEPASADASFRRYFRVTRGADSHIAMDAPPAKEDLRAYLRVTDMLASFGLNVPLVLARNVPDGLLLLSDLGTRLFFFGVGGGSVVVGVFGGGFGGVVGVE